MKDIFARIRNLDMGYRVLFFVIFLVIFLVLQYIALWFIGAFVKTWMVVIFDIVIILYLAFQTLRGRS